MSPFSIIVVGAEGSGTTLLWECVAGHPQLAAMRAMPAPAANGPLPAADAILRVPLPALRPKRWFGGEAAPRGARVIVLRRSPLHTVFSTYRRFYRAPKPAWRNYLHAAALEASWIARHQPLCLSYEDLVHNAPAVLCQLYAFLGVDTDFVPPIEIADRNDDRWSEDQRFASFMRRALGFDAQRIPYARNQSGTSAPPVRLRGGAVLWRGGAILLPGDRGAGTSQLVAAFARAGARPLADGEVALDDEGRVLVVDTAAGREPEAFDVALVVATVHEEGAEWRPEELRGARAVVPILDRAVTGRDASPHRLLRIAARLAARVTTLAGSHPQTDPVAAEILAYLDKLHDRSSPQAACASNPERPSWD